MLLPPPYEANYYHSEPTCRPELVSGSVSESKNSRTPNGYNPHPSPLPRRGNMFAFTLAEVLITLVIIGVIAAITIPVTMQSQRRQEVITKLKHASSVLMQANSRAYLDYGDANNKREGFPANDPDAALEMFNKYYVPYISFLKVEKGEKGVFGYLQNGSIIYFRRQLWDGNDGWANTYITLCLNARAKNGLDENDDNSWRGNGKNTFLFYTTGTVPTYTFKVRTHEQRVESCRTSGGEGCTALIFEAGWQIPDDYPIGI